MSDLNPLALHEVEREIMRLVTSLSRLTTDMAQVSSDWARARHDYKIAYAQAYLRAKATLGKVTDGVCVSHATAECEEQHWAMLREEALLDATKEAGRNCRSQLEALRSINVNTREVVEHSRGVGP